MGTRRPVVFDGVQEHDEIELIERDSRDHKDAGDRNEAFFDRAAKTDGLPRPSVPPSLGSGNLGPVDVAEKVGILAN